ncbi:MAG: NAD(P)H-dependent oxidoreductase subunit E, partial [Chitinispirillia bacterium]
MVNTEPDIQKNDFDSEPVDALIDKFGKSPDKIIPLLQEIQKIYRYLPEPVLKYVGEKTDISLSSIAGVSSFYSMFRFSPTGLHLIKICIGTACHVKGAENIFSTLRSHLHCKGNSDTDPDGLFTLQKVACLGCCTLAPVVQIEGETYGHVTPSTVSHIISDFLKNKSYKLKPLQIENKPEKRSPEGEIRIGLGSCCIAGGSARVGASVCETIKRLNIPIVVKKVGCVGMCHQTPLLEIHPRGKDPSFYARVSARDVPGILYKHFKPKGLIRNVKTYINWKAKEYLSGTKFDETADTFSINIKEKPVGDFLNKQIHIATERYGTMDPLDIEEYKNNDGFKALKLCIKENSPQNVIDTISQSGLRGRGGGGYETSRKWRHVLSQKGKIKYIICNGDEGDPGAF